MNCNKDSGIDKKNFSVVHNKFNPKTKSIDENIYIYLGKVPKDIRKILNKIEHKIDIKNLLKSEINILIDFFGKGYLNKLKIKKLEDYDNFKYVTDNKIYSDDTINIIIKKILITLSNSNLYNFEWISLFLNNNQDNIVPISFRWYNTLEQKDSEISIPYPVESKSDNINVIEYKNIYKNNGEQILLDHINNIKSENIILHVYDVISFLEYNNHEKIITKSNLSNIIKIYWHKILYNSNIYKYHIIEKSNIDIIQVNKEILLSDNGQEFLYSINNTIDPNEFKCAIFNSSVSVNEEDKIKNPFIDIEKLFYYIKPSYTIHQVSLIHPKKVGKNNIIKFSKNYFYDIINNEKKRGDILEQLKPSKSRDGKIKIKYNNVKYDDSNFTLILYDNGYYKIINSWKETDYSSYYDIKTTLKLITMYLNKFNSYNNIFYGEEKIKLPLYNEKDDTDINIKISNLEFRILFKLKQSFDPNLYIDILQHFKSHVLIIDDSDIIRKHFSYRKDVDFIINKLKEKNLLNIIKIQSLSYNEITNLKILSNSNENQNIILQLKRLINIYKKKELVSFVYKKFSDFKHKTRIFKFISNLVSEKNIKMSDLSSNTNQEILYIQNEINKRFLIPLDEIKILYHEWYDNNSKDARKLSAGIKCTIYPRQDEKNSYRIKIEGIKNFTGNSDLQGLIQKIYFFLSRVQFIYTNYSKYQNSPEFKSLLNVQDEDSDDIMVEQNDIIPIYDELDLSEFDQQEMDDYQLEYDDDDELDNEISEEQIVESINTTQDVNKNEVSEVKNEEYEDKNIDYSKLKGEYRLRELVDKDPTIFNIVKQKGRKSYAQVCQPSSRQPIILDEQEYKNINKNLVSNPKSMKDGFKYRNYYYICPQIWCPTSKQVITIEELVDPEYDVDNNIINGKCPDGDDAIISNDKDKYPGFLSKEFHPDGLCVPCCFKTDQSSSIGKINLFNSCMNSKSKFVDKNVSEQSKKYIYKDTKLLEYGRKGLLDNELNQGLNGNQCNTNFIEDSFNCYIRIGTRQSNLKLTNNTFLTSILLIYNSYKGESVFQNEYDIRQKMASYILENERLFYSLNNGNLELFFKNYDVKSVNAYSEYILYNDSLNINFIYDYISRPIPWLFKNGVNIIIFVYESKKVSINCPSKYYSANVFDKNRPSILLYYRNNVYEPIIKVSGSHKDVAIFNDVKNINLDKIFGCYFTEKYLSVKEYNNNLLNLNSELQNEYKIKYQYINLINKVFTILLKNGLYISLKPFSGIDDKIPMSDTKNLYKNLLEGSDLGKKLIKASNILKLEEIYPENIVYNIDKKRYIGYILKNDTFIPFIKSDKKPIIRGVNLSVINGVDTNLLNIDDKQVNNYLNNILYEKQYIKELYKTFRYELSRFFQDEMVIKNHQNKSYITYVHEILNGVYPNGNKMKKEDKRVLLDKLFKNGFDNIKPLGEIIFSVNNTKNINIKDHVSSNVLKYCRKFKNELSCNVNNNCVFDEGNCKIYIPSNFKNLFIFHIIEELLRVDILKNEILINKVDNVINYINLDYDKDYIILNYDMYVRFMKYFNTRSGNNFSVYTNYSNLDNYYLNNIPDYSDIEYKSDMEIKKDIKSIINIKNNIIPIMKNVNVIYKSKDLSNYWSKFFPSSYKIITINMGSIYDVIYVAIRKDTSDILNPITLKNRVISLLQVGKKWNNLLKNYKNYSKQYSKINGMNKFFDYMLSLEHLGYLEEIPFIIEVLNLNIIVLNHNAVNDKNNFVCIGKNNEINKDDKYIIVNLVYPNRFSLVINKDSHGRNISIFSYNDLPEIFINKFTQICSK